MKVLKVVNLKEKMADSSENDDKLNLFLNSLHKMAVDSMLKSHLWGVDDLKKFADKMVDFDSLKSGSEKLFLLHYTDIALAADFFISKKVGYIENICEENFSIDKNTKVDFVKKSILPALLDTEKPKHVVIAFFEENIDVANMIDKIVYDNPPDKWNERTKLFILVDNSFEMPPNLILSFRLFALE